MGHPPPKRPPPPRDPTHVVRLREDSRHDELERFYTRQARRGALIILGGVVFLVTVGLSLAGRFDAGIVGLEATLLVIAAVRHATLRDQGPPRRLRSGVMVMPTAHVSEATVLRIANGEPPDPFEASAVAVGRGEKTLEEHERDVEKLLRANVSPPVSPPPGPRHPRWSPWNRPTPPKPADADRRPPPPPPPPPRREHGPNDHLYAVGSDGRSDNRCVICHQHEDDEGLGTRGERR